MEISHTHLSSDDELGPVGPTTVWLRQSCGLMQAIVFPRTLKEGKTAFSSSCTQPALKASELFAWEITPRRKRPAKQAGRTPPL